MYRGLNNILVTIVLLISLFSRAQSDSIPYVRYSKQPVFYTDLGFSTAPIKLVYPFSEEISRLKYKNNMSAVLGLGFSYKWFALRLGITLPGTMRPESRYGKTTYYDLGVDFSVKRCFFDIDFHMYSGYAIKNAYRWNDSLDQIYPNELRPDVNSASFSINTWVFRSDDFKMHAFRGKTGLYKKDVHSLYFKYTFNVHGMESEIGMPLVPTPLQDSTQSKSRTNAIFATDIGVIPGIAYVKRWRTFQVGIMAGLGAVIQSKFYAFDGTSRGFLGLAPRYDVKFIAGYNQPRYFLLFVTDFDNKSIRFNDFSYRQTFYNLKIVAGIRLNKKEDRKKGK